jgi:hypothetical protein
VGDDLGVGRGEEDTPLRFELGPQQLRVDDVAVVAESDLAVGAVHDEGLGVFDLAGAGGGVARVAGGGEALQMQKVFLLEDLRDKAHVLVVVYGESVGCGDACALLAPVLERVETKKGDSSDVFCWGVNPENAAGLVKAVQSPSPPQMLELVGRTQILTFTAISGQTVRQLTNT